MNKAKKQVALAIALLGVGVAHAHAEATAYFSLPADFAESVNLTLVGIAGAILVVLGLMFAWRKTVKSVNRS